MGTNNRSASSVPETEQALFAVAKVLLQGIGACVPNEDANEHQQFCVRLREAAEYLAISPSPQASVLQAESAVKSLRDYTARVAKRQRLKNAEVLSVVGVLMKTLEDLKIASPERMQQLMAIGKKLEAARDAEELRAAKGALSECLAEVRLEAERHVAEASADKAKDPLTNLETRPSAEAALVAACSAKHPVSAAVVTIDRVALYNRRYGREVGDKVLRFFTEYVKHCFAPGAALYRWTGPVILILIPGTLDKGQALVRAALENRLQYECEVGSRTILLAVDATWSVFPMMVDPRLLINKIDAFVN